MFENVVLQRNSRNSEILIANYKLRRETRFLKGRRIGMESTLKISAFCQILNV